MNPTRLFLGAILPIPLYCLGSAVYSFGSLVHHPENISTLALLWLGYGILFMGIPSILYSIAIEMLRSRQNAALGVISTLGAIIGFICGSLFLLFGAPLAAFYSMSLPGAAIGGLIPILLHRIRESESGPGE